MSDHRFIAALMGDDSLPMSEPARSLWVKDLQNPLRYWLLPLLRVTQTILLHLIYYTKRLLPFQFSAHRLLQGQINFFMKHFVTPEANWLILHHMWVETQVLNFILDNSKRRDEVKRVELYPQEIDDLMENNFVLHDRELFRVLAEAGPTTEEAWPPPFEEVDFSAIKPIEMSFDQNKRRWTQFIDFETAHELFKVTFCFLLKAEEYEAALNSLQFDQSMCRRVGKILGNPELDGLSFNRYPLVLHHTNAVSERFVFHGVTLEHLYAYLESEAARQRALKAEPHPEG
jgi:hypothetical protein